ncbi:1,4-dihydroxy-2-naphthoate polyprenyltransferase [Kineococcus rhizosphaerae]|uniref:1,4-dihydroxy-2-naphthoate octaprenyltransferase n=1 Tax=Kineococcus rhizosphaerae TaxID=559628 RepID=A0A2T0R5A9_9ACTN|nr:1,4-dihydroxy-2-naphthoate polyprenyltransferase [Kineococcus rhizosphaerae]PRY15953.1 1,4-dihydroxy-2-naphthoate prenyltransferase [Kineococcus rhizosphaerae]
MSDPADLPLPSAPVTHRRATPKQWVAAARPRTLPAAVTPVLVGTGAAAAIGGVAWVPAVLALVVSLALQVGVNYANDYSDGIRGTDDDRVGPFRLVGSGAAEPRHVRDAAFACFAVAALAGLAVVALSGAWWLLAVGAASVAAAWYYTGGRRPYGYSGLGEVFVFVFFGLVAVMGTTFVQAGRIGGSAVAGAFCVGFLACAILVANNLRDVPTDAQVGKRTLAVRLGERRTRTLYAALVVGAFVAALTTVPRHPFALLVLLALVLAQRPLRTVLGGATGRDLIGVLKDTGLLELLTGALLALGLAL